MAGRPTLFLPRKEDRRRLAADSEMPRDRISSNSVCQLGLRDIVVVELIGFKDSVQRVYIS